MLLFTELIASLEDAEITGLSDVAVQRIVADSREVQPQDLFVAVRGSAIDGHDMIAEAVERGATVVVGDRHIAEVDFGHHHSHRSIEVTYVRVPNSRTAHAALLRATRPEIRRALAAIRFIGVTGTNGKTTVATVLEQCLQLLGEPVAFIGTTGYRFGAQEIEATHTTPDVERLYGLIVQAFELGLTSIVMEVSSHALDQDRVDGLPFAVAAFTNLTRDHLDYHQTMEDYASAKQRLFTGLAPTSIAVLCGDDPWATFMKRDCPAERILMVGRAPENTVRITSEEAALDGSRYTLDGLPLETRLVGAFNVLNTALCATILRELGYDASAIQRSIAAAAGAAGRLQQIRLPNGALAVVDYAHTPDALENALLTLRPLLAGTSGRLHVVMGCGGERDRGKRPIMGEIAARCADQVWITSDNPRREGPAAIIDEILAGIPEQIAGSQAVRVIEDRRAAITEACLSAAPSDIVLIAGKGHENYQIIGTERHPFSDAEVVASVR